MKYYSASWDHWCLTIFEKLLEKKINMTLLSGSEWKKELSVKVEKTDVEITTEKRENVDRCQRRFLRKRKFRICYILPN